MPKRPMQDESTPVKMSFPLAGVDLTMGYVKQPNRPMINGDYASTTPDAMNVRAFDPVSGRARGGQRPGLSRYAVGTVNSSNSIQELSYVVEPGLVQGGSGTVPGWGVATPHVFIRKSDQVGLNFGSSYDWTLQAATSGSTAATAGIGVNTGSCVFYITPGVGNRVEAVAATTTTAAVAAIPNPPVWNIAVGGVVIASGNLPNNANPLTTSACTDGTDFYAAGQNQGSVAPGLNTYWAIKVGQDGTVAWTQTSAGDITPAVGTSLSATAQSSCVVVGTVLYILFFKWGIASIKTTDGTASGTGRRATHAGIVGAAGSSGLYQIDPGKNSTTSPGPVGQLTAVGSTLAVAVKRNPGTTNATRLLQGLLGVVYVQTSNGAFSPTAQVDFGQGDGYDNNLNTSLVLANDGTNFYALMNGGILGARVKKLDGTTGAVTWTKNGIGGDIRAITYSSGLTSILVSGPGASYALSATDGSISNGGLGVGTLAFADCGSVNTLESLADDSDAANKSNYNRALCLVAVAAGTPKVYYAGTWQSINAGGGTISSTVAVVRSTGCQGKLFFVDGGSNYSYYDPVPNSHKAWAATAGTLPVDQGNFKAKLICTWRNRVILAGLPLDAKNIFASAQDDPFDFDYAPASTTATQAWALNTGIGVSAGQVPQNITCLIPYTDDVLIIGCDSATFMMSGDPASGGRLDLVSHSTGIAWGNPWCTDPAGNIYFMSNYARVYQLTIGQQPVQISQSISQLLKKIDLDKSVVRMAWDDENEGFLLTVTHYSGAQSDVHYFWEQRSGAWQPMSFNNNDHNPKCLLSFQGNSAANRAVLLGSYDGYVRALTRDAATDDGSNIYSRVVIGPILTNDSDELVVRDIQAILGEESGPVSYEVLTGRTPEQALASLSTNYSRVGTFNAGRTPTTGTRLSGHAIYLRLTAANPWSAEAIVGKIEGKGRIRKRY